MHVGNDSATRTCHLARFLEICVTPRKGMATAWAGALHCGGRLLLVELAERLWVSRRPAAFDLGWRSIAPSLSTCLL